MEPEQGTPKGLENLPRWVSGPLAFLLAIGTVGAAVVGLLQQAKDPERRNEILIGGLAVLLFGGLAFLWKLIQKRIGPASSFAHPAKLKIGQKYLYGREDEIKSLQGRLKDYPLVFLVGESGAGKSSLLEQGLAPKLREEPLTLPVYLNHWGADWIEGPRRTVADALSQTLGPELREKLGIKGPLTADQVFPILSRLHDKLGYRTMLLLDQFDDYQVRHRDRFLRSHDREVLRAQALVQENPFWKSLEELLKSDKLRCLVATRDDAQWGLESVRFQEPGLYILPLLEREHAAALLDAVAAEAGVKEPERGFHQLRDRLLQDLAPEGLVLPIQMKAVLQGLAELRPLSLAGYTREGGLSGLQALSIARAIAQAARQGGWTAEVVRRLLVAMVDPVSRQKTVPRSKLELLGEVPAEQRDEKKLEAVLASLREDDVVRFRANPDLGTAVWQLDHDYLCRGVLELDRRARRWPLLLEESSQAFAAARGLRARWRSLLSPTTQTRLLWERLRGRLIYGRERKYAALSFFRFIGNVWIPLVALGLVVANFYPIWKATELFGSFRAQGQLNPEEARALWDLSHESTGVRSAFLNVAFTKQSRAETLTESDFLIYAVLGLDEARANSLLKDILTTHCSRSHPEEQYQEVCLSLTRQMPILQENAEFFLRLAKGNSDFSGNFDPGLLEKLSAESRNLAIANLAARIESEKDVEEIQRLAVELMVFRDFIPPTLAERLIGQMLSLREQGVAGGLMWAIAGLMPRLPPASFKRDFNRIGAVRECGRTSNLQPSEDVFLAVPEALCASLSGQAQLCIEAELQKGNVRAVRIFKAFRTTLPPKIRQEMALKVAQVYFSLKNKAEVGLSEISSFIGYLPTDRQVMTVEMLQLGFEPMPDLPVSPEASKVVVWSLVELMASGDLSQRSLAMTYGHLFLLAKNLSPPDARRVSERLLTNLLASQDEWEIVTLSAALGSLEYKLPPDVAHRASEYVSTLLAVEKSPQQIRRLASALAELGNAVPDDTADKAAERILILLEKTSDSYQLIQSLGALGEQVSSPMQKAALEKFLQKAKPFTEPPCGSAAPLIRGDDVTLQKFIDLLKWPTCSENDRGILTKRLEEITGKDFFRPGSWREVPDLWAVARWAEEKGWAPTAPSPAPKNIIASPEKRF